MQGAGLGLFIHPPPLVAGCGFFPGVLIPCRVQPMVYTGRACYKGQGKPSGKEIQVLRTGGEAGGPREYG